MGISTSSVSRASSTSSSVAPIASGSIDSYGRRRGGLAHRGLQRSVTLSPRARLVHSHARPHGSGTELAWHRGRRTRPGPRGRCVPGAGIHVRRDRRTRWRRRRRSPPDPRRTGRRYRRVLGRRRVRALASAQRGVRPARRRAGGAIRELGLVHRRPGGTRTLTGRESSWSRACAPPPHVPRRLRRPRLGRRAVRRAARAGDRAGRRGRAGDVGRALDPDGGALRRGDDPVSCAHVVVDGGALEGERAGGAIARVPNVR